MKILLRAQTTPFLFIAILSFFSCGLNCEGLQEFVQNGFLTEFQARQLGTIELSSKVGGYKKFAISSIEFEFSKPENMLGRLYPTSFSAIKSFLQACFYVQMASDKSFPSSFSQTVSLVNFFLFAKKFLLSQDSLSSILTHEKNEFNSFLSFMRECENSSFDSKDFFVLIKGFGAIEKYRIIDALKIYSSHFALDLQRQRLLWVHVQVVFDSIAHFGKGESPAIVIADQGRRVQEFMLPEVLGDFLQGSSPIFAIVNTSGLDCPANVSMVNPKNSVLFSTPHSFLLGLIVQNHFGSKTLRVMVYYPYPEVSRTIVKAKVIYLLANMFAPRGTDLAAKPRTLFGKPFVAAAFPEATLSKSELEELVPPKIPSSKPLAKAKRFRASSASRLFSAALIVAARRRLSQKRGAGYKPFVKADSSVSSGSTVSITGGGEFDSGFSGVEPKNSSGFNSKSVDGSSGVGHGWAELDDDNSVQEDGAFQDSYGSYAKRIIPDKEKVSVATRIAKAINNRPEGMSVDQAFEEACKEEGIDDLSPEAIEEILGKEAAKLVEDAYFVATADKGLVIGGEQISLPVDPSIGLVGDFPPKSPEIVKDPVRDQKPLSGAALIDLPEDDEAFEGIAKGSLASPKSVKNVGDEKDQTKGVGIIERGKEALRKAREKAGSLLLGVAGSIYGQ